MPSPKSLFEKVWDAHAVRTLANGQTQLLIGTHLIQEVTSPQAFGMLRDLGLKVAMPHRTFATVDHIVPTDQFVEPYRDPLAQAMMRGANAAVVGILASALYDPVWTGAVLNPRDFAVALIGFVLLTVWKTPPWVVVVLTAASGVGLALL